jgi:spore photoproduct lyase
MAKTEPYATKFARISKVAVLAALPERERSFIQEKAHKYRFTFQELRLITEMALDFSMWNEPSIVESWPHNPLPDDFAKKTKNYIIQSLRARWESLKRTPHSYHTFSASVRPKPKKPELVSGSKHKLALGHCPVASHKTRCCNLLTLDAVENCGFGCSYCTIQPFYHGAKIHFDDGFATKLRTLKLDPDQVYHIGTGQSSDSLMWGNKHGILEALFEFASENPNVLLELKTKSKNIAYLQKHEVPKNIICTWSLNTPIIINHEEHFTASLGERLAAARKVANRGGVVGFHLHPMVYYDNWKQDYADLFNLLQAMFDPSEVAMLSIGTLTFIKPMLKQIRSKNFKSKILQMPLVDSDGKLSYPEETKIQMFSWAYNGFKGWHDRVFFYLCMENPKLWKPVFGFEYPSNEVFETAMKKSYRAKINQKTRRLLSNRE